MDQPAQSSRFTDDGGASQSGDLPRVMQAGDTGGRARAEGAVTTWTSPHLGVSLTELIEYSLCLLGVCN